MSNARGRAHCRRRDRGAFDLMKSLGSPSYLTPLASEAYSLDGSNQHSSGSWKRFAGMRTGEVKRIVLLGYTVLHTDCDVVFLRDPAPYLMCHTDAAEWADGAHYPCSASAARTSPSPRTTCHPAATTTATRATRPAARSTRGCSSSATRPRARPLSRSWHSLVVSPPSRSRFSTLTSDQQVFNNMMRKERDGRGSPRHTARWLMDPWDKSLKLGGLPMALFINGHGYFVQAAHRRLKTTPIAVHATYSLDNHDAPSPRRSASRGGLWSVDDDFLLREGKFLALNRSVAPDVQAAIDKYVQPPRGRQQHRRPQARRSRRTFQSCATPSPSTSDPRSAERSSCRGGRATAIGSGRDRTTSSWLHVSRARRTASLCRLSVQWTVALPRRAGARRAHTATRPSWNRPDSASAARQSAASPSSACCRAPRRAADGPRAAESAPLPLARPTRRCAGRRRVRCDRVGDRLAGCRTRMGAMWWGNADRVARVNALSNNVLQVPQWCAKWPYQPCAQELAKWLPSRPSLRQPRMARWRWNASTLIVRTKGFVQTAGAC